MGGTQEQQREERLGALRSGAGDGLSVEQPRIGGEDAARPPTQRTHTHAHLHTSDVRQVPHKRKCQLRQS